MAKKLPYDEYIEIYSKVPRLCIDLVIIKDGKVLLIKRDVNPGYGLWHLPGGTVLKGESIIDAAKRICFEEAGIRIDDISFIGIMEFSNKRNLFYHVISMVYKVELSKEVMAYLKNLPSNINLFDNVPLESVPEQRSFLKAHFLT